MAARSTVIHDFQKSAAKGATAEAALDAYFSRWYQIETIPNDIQRIVHADRLFIKPDGSQSVVEYKADFHGTTSGRLFIEVIANDVSGAPGWVDTSRADFLVFYLPQTGDVLVAPFQDVRDSLALWSRKYVKVRSFNPGYASVGVLVPVEDFQRLCVWVDNIN